ncbi:MAG TPA: Ger(x)C family spore germination protein [Oscillospiraceae bacterium]|nr:Ger(x)C family spore germination protein [Oscillospiraceae bacterium]
MNKYPYVFLIIVFCIFLTGCWSYREINSLYVVAGIGIDKVPDSDLFNITAELVNIRESGSRQEEQKFESALLEIKGSSIFDTVRKIIRISSKKPYLAHATVIIVSEEVAHEGIISLLDLIAANEEPRLDISVLVSRGKTANEVLGMKSLSTEIISFELSTAINENEKLMRVPVLRAYEIIDALAVPKTGTVIPVVTSFNDKGTDLSILSGGAVFRADKLAGFLEQKDIVPYLFIKNKIKMSVLDIETKEDDKEGTATLETYRNHTKIKPVYGEAISFDIDIKTEAVLVELDTMTDYIGSAGRTKLKKIAEKHLENKIKNHIEDVKKDFEFDIFGFGNIIRQRNPKLWKELEKDWDTIFVDTDFNINCKILIKGAGHALKPVRAVD